MANPVSIAVTASAEVAFDFVADPTNEKDWNPGVVRAAETLGFLDEPPARLEA